MAVAVRTSRSTLWRRLGGPLIFKEMLSASRRRRSYHLRLGYVLLLMAFSVLAWQAATQGMGAFTISRMADAGKYIVNRVAWFQFIAVQVVVALLAGGAISGELQRRTLPILLTTPLSYGEMALGKIASSVWQVLVLMACSLPVLALVRVFGGVPWSFILVAVGLSVSTAILVSATAVYLSSRFSQGWLASVLAMAIIAVYHGLMCMGAVAVFPFLAMLLLDGSAMRRLLQRKFAVVVLSVLVLVLLGLLALLIRLQPGTAAMTSPAAAMWTCSQEMLFPGSSSNAYAQGAINCLINLAVAMMMVKRTTWRLARLAKEKLWGPPVAYTRFRGDELDMERAMRRLAGSPVEDPDVPSEEAPPARVANSRPAGSAYTTGEVTCLGSPVLWHDLRGPLRRKPVLRGMLVLFPATVIIIYYLAAVLSAPTVRSQGWHVMMLSFWVILAGVLAGVAAPALISSERQARTLPLLLCTPMSRWRIFGAKLLATGWYAGLPALAATGHVLVFTALGHLDIRLLPALWLVLVGMFVPIAGCGFVAGAYVRQPAVSACVNLAILAVLWLGLPQASSLLGGVICQKQSVMPAWVPREQPLYELPRSLAPWEQICVSTNANSGPEGRYVWQGKYGFWRGRGQYWWRHSLSGDIPWNAGESFKLMSIAAAGNMLAGLALTWLAKIRLTRNAFS